MNANEVIREAALERFDISLIVQVACEAIREVQYIMQRPSAVYKPAIKLDGSQWCALYGENIQDGVAGFGDTPELAMIDFDRAWVSSR